MANTGRSRSGSSSKSSKRTSSSKSGSSSKRTAQARKNTQVQTESAFSDGLQKFASSKAAMPLIFLASVILIIGLDLLVSWNKYELFFKILGVEVLIAVIVWGVLTLVFSGKKNLNGSSSDEV